MKISRYQCWIKYLWRSIWSVLRTGFPMDGHNYQDIEYHRGCDVCVSKCEICGKIDIGWGGGKEIKDAKEFYGH